MKTLLIACGNPLRGDDGAAHAVVTMLKGGAGVAISQNQLTPELAADLARYDRALFLDADADATSPRIEPVGGFSTAAPTLSHASSPAEILHLARTLFDFRRAYICHIPARDFSPCEGLSPECLRAARQTCVMIEGGAFS